MRPMQSIVLALALVVIVACQDDLPVLPERPTTGREWVEASVRYHDPQGRWPAFKADVEINTLYPDGAFFYRNEVLLNHVTDSFRRKLDFQGFPLLQTFGQSSGCQAIYDNPQPTAAQLTELGLLGDACPSIRRGRDYYQFLIGLPMSALNPGIELSLSPSGSGTQIPLRTSIFGQTVVAVDMDILVAAYPRWTLYFHSEQASLVAAGFVYENGSGEIIYYPELVPFDGFRLKSQQLWYNLALDRLIIQDVLSYKRI